MAVDAMKHRPLDVHYRQAVCVVRGARNRVEPTEEVVVERRGLAARVRVDPREVAARREVDGRAAAARVGPQRVGVSAVPGESGVSVRRERRGKTAATTTG